MKPVIHRNECSSLSVSLMSTSDTFVGKEFEFWSNFMLSSSNIICENKSGGGLEHSDPVCRDH